MFDGAIKGRAARLLGLEILWPRHRHNPELTNNVTQADQGLGDRA